MIFGSVFFFLRTLFSTSPQPSRTFDGNHICDQVSRSGTSIGANVEEADGGTTKAEKRRAFIIARKESQETRYWLRIICKRWPETPGANDALQEVTEIKSILSAIIDKLS